eukprot:3206867-Lingulodinium_polyedra.AAC.1
MPAREPTNFSTRYATNTATRPAFTLASVLSTAKTQIHNPRGPNAAVAQWSYLERKSFKPSAIGAASPDKFQSP